MRLKNARRRVCSKCIIFEWKSHEKLKKKKIVGTCEMERTMPAGGTASNIGLHCSTSFNKHCVSRVIDLPPESSRVLFLLPTETHTRKCAHAMKENDK